MPSPSASVQNSSSTSTQSVLTSNTNNTSPAMTHDNSSGQVLVTKQDEISFQNLDRFPDYSDYVARLATQKCPSSKIVLDFLNSTSAKSTAAPLHCPEQGGGCVICNYFRLYVLALHEDETYTTFFQFMDHSQEPADRRVENMIRAVIKKSEEKSEPKVERFILIIEDVKPDGMKVLGTFFNVDPRIFERFLNYRREYTNGLSKVHVLDYSQGYFYCTQEGNKVYHKFQDDALASAKLRGKLRRMWRDVVGHEQRIVVASLPETNLIKLPTDMVLSNALPEPSDLEFSQGKISSKSGFKLEPFGSMKDFPSFFHFRDKLYKADHELSDISTRSNIAAILFAITLTIRNSKVPIDQKVISGAVHFVGEKWTSMIDQIQEAISETDVPESSELSTIRVIMQRKHLYAELKRTLDTLCESLMGQELNDTRETLYKTMKKIENWVAELESTLTLLMSYLSLDETEREIVRSRRTNQLTILAFVFIPISTVSSIFGMNVDIIQKNPPIYWFAITAAAVSVITFGYAVFFQYINYGMGASVVWLLSLGLDVTFLLMKIPLVLLWWLPWILTFILIVMFAAAYTIFGCFSFIASLGKGLEVLAEYFAQNGKVASRVTDFMGYAQVIFAWAWNGSLAIIEWSPKRLEMRLLWRVGKRAPRAPGLDDGLGDNSCIVM